MDGLLDFDADADNFLSDIILEYYGWISDFT